MLSIFGGTSWRTPSTITFTPRAVAVLTALTMPSGSAGLMIKSLTPRVTRSSTSEICFCSLPWPSVLITS